MKKLIALILAMMMVLSLTACGGETAETQASTNAPAAQATVVGEGATVFAFSVVDLEGNETAFEIHTDKEIVGEALEELGLLEGSEGDYGLYVSTVNGITSDWDADQTYWAFYVNGEYGLAGVDMTEIAVDTAYSMVLTKG